MEPFETYSGLVVPLDRANVDTDAIIPKQFLRKIERTGFGKHLFHEWRYLDKKGTVDNPDFSINKPEFCDARILLARENFGCGSSREHAPWAIADYGFRVIIAPSFADIFYNNCVKNGILLITLKSKEVDELFTAVNSNPGFKVTADLNNQSLRGQDDRVFHFEIDSFPKYCLLNGLDQIGWTLQFKDKIDSYEKKLESSSPWLA